MNRPGGGLAQCGLELPVDPVALHRRENLQGVARIRDPGRHIHLLEDGACDLRGSLVFGTPGDVAIDVLTFETVDIEEQHLRSLRPVEHETSQDRPFQSAPLAREVLARLEYDRHVAALAVHLGELGVDFADEVDAVVQVQEDGAVEARQGVVQVIGNRVDQRPISARVGDRDGIFSGHLGS